MFYLLLFSFYFKYELNGTNNTGVLIPEDTGVLISEEVTNKYNFTVHIFSTFKKPNCESRKEIGSGMNNYWQCISKS